MTSGLLWYDSKSPLAQTIAHAAKRYREKFGYAPDTCFINADTPPETLAALRAMFEPQGLDIKTKNTIMPKHVWLGVSVAREPVNQ